MPLNDELLKILVCPQTHQKLRHAPISIVERVNAVIQKGEGRNQIGDTITEAVNSGLLREDGRILYPIRNEIPVLLAEEGITVPEAL